MSWIISTDATQDGSPADMGNPIMFWVIHIAALLNIVLSMISCVSVLVHMHIRARREANQSTVANATAGSLDAVRSGQAAAISTSGIKKMTKHSFATRLTLYLAVVDLVWGCSHFMDHMWLMISREFPERFISIGLSANLWIFFGFQQLVHAVLSAYTYSKVCHNRTIKWGRHDWKLHALCAVPILALTPVFYFTNGFGPVGYWCMGNARTTSGRFLNFMACVVSTINAVATTWGYHAIRKTLRSVGMSIELDVGFGIGPFFRQLFPFCGGQRRPSAGTKAGCGRDPNGAIATFNVPSAIHSDGGPVKNGAIGKGLTDESGSSLGNPQSPTASAVRGVAAAVGQPEETAKRRGKQNAVCRSQLAAHCLSSIMRTASWMYIPLAISLGAVSLASFAHIIEPLSSLVVVVTANCSGMVNSYAYFSNYKVKKKLLGSDYDDT